MDFRPLQRGAGSFQASVTAGQVQAMCNRAFGGDARVVAAVELGNGMYNSTYRVDVAGLDGPVILRVAPERSRHYRIERDLMRNEHASVPYLAPIAAMMPRTLAVDFTGEIIARDYMFQTMLPGTPAPDGLGDYPRGQWGGFFAQLGTIARAVHAVRGDRFGPVTGPGFATWSEAVISWLEKAAADMRDVGLDASDLRAVIGAAHRDQGLLDEVTQPRLLSGDLWTVNVIVASGAPDPSITGVFDLDRTSWGDPAADWPVFMAARRPGSERDAFWDTYEPLPATQGAIRRSVHYRAAHTAAIRLERHRLGRSDPEIGETYADMAEILQELLQT